MVTGQEAVPNEDEMRLRLRTNRERQDGPEQVPLAPEAQDAHLRSDRLGIAAAFLAGTLALAAWAALAPWTIDIERPAEVALVEVNVTGPLLLAGMATGWLGSCWAVAGERRWPSTGRRPRSRVAAACSECGTNGCSSCPS